MFEQLIESGPGRRAGLSPSASSIAVHATLIVLAVHAVKHGPPVQAPPKPFEVTMDYPTPSQPVMIDGGGELGVAVVPAPTLVPTTIDPITLAAPSGPTPSEIRFPTGDLARQLASDGGRPGPMTDWLGAIGRDSLSASEAPVPIELADPVYPASLKAAGVEGSVTIEFVVGVTGMADSSSIKVIAAEFEAFGQAARAAVLLSRFRPGSSFGHPVPVRVRQMVRFLVK